MNPLLFGIDINPTAARGAEALNLARLADELNLDHISVQDHPYNAAFFDTWTFITALGMITRRTHLLTNVVNLPLRPPAVLAKSAATLDLLTSGRVELGIGAGGFWEGIAAYGGPHRQPAEAFHAVEEAIAIMRALWKPSGSGVVQFEGDHYTLNAQPGPAPAHPIRIWIGASGPRMLDLTGRLADGIIWSVPYIPETEIPAKNALIDEGAAKAGRDPSEIRRAYNVPGAILTDNTRGITARRPGIMVGTVEEWVDKLVHYAADLRFDTFTLWPITEPETQIRLWSEEVVPAVREAVGQVI